MNTSVKWLPSGKVDGITQKREPILSISVRYGWVRIGRECYKRLVEGKVIKNIVNNGWTVDIGVGDGGEIYLKEGSTTKLGKKRKNGIYIDELGGTHINIARWCGEVFRESGTVTFGLLGIKNGVAIFKRGV